MGHAAPPRLQEGWGGVRSGVFGGVFSEVRRFSGIFGGPWRRSERRVSSESVCACVLRVCACVLQRRRSNIPFSPPLPSLRSTILGRAMPSWLLSRKWPPPRFLIDRRSGKFPPFSPYPLEEWKIGGFSGVFGGPWRSPEAPQRLPEVLGDLRLFVGFS